MALHVSQTCTMWQIPELTAEQQSQCSAPAGGFFVHSRSYNNRGSSNMFASCNLRSSRAQSRLKNAHEPVALLGAEHVCCHCKR